MTIDEGRILLLPVDSCGECPCHSDSEYSDICNYPGSSVGSMTQDKGFPALCPLKTKFTIYKMDEGGSQNEGKMGK